MVKPRPPILDAVAMTLDEAHAAGVYREEGRGFFRGKFERAAVVVTFGKAIGVAGAVVLATGAITYALSRRPVA